MSKRKNKRKHNNENTKAVENIVENIEVKEADNSETVENNSETVEDNSENVENKPIEETVQTDRAQKEMPEEKCENESEDIVATQELNDKQLEDLNNIKNKIDSDVNKLENSINAVKQLRELWNRLLNYMQIHHIRIIETSVVLVFLLVLLVVARKTSDIDVVKESKQTVSSSSIISISMDNATNTLNYRIERLCIGSTNTADENTKYTSITNLGWVRRALDTDTTSYNIDNEEHELPANLSLNQFIITRQYGYIEYINEQSNGNKELILSCSKPTNIDTSLIQKVNNRSYEYITPINIRSYVNSFNDSFLMLTESIGGGKLTIDSLLPEIKNIEKAATVSDNTEGIILRFRGLESISIDEINPDLKNDIGVVYNGTTLNIRNIITGEDLIKIGEIDNPEIGCYKEDLLSTTTDNVYVSTNDSLTIAIIAENNLYVLKFIDKDTMINFGEQLGIDLSNLKISKIQEVIK